MDLKDLIPTTDTITVTVKHPSTYEPLKNEDGSDMTITLYAPHTKEFKAAAYAQTNKRLKQAQTNKGKRQVNTSFEFTAEDLEESSVQLLAETTKEWNITFDGEQPEFSVNTAKQLYSEVFWIKGQLDEETQEYDAFT